MRPRQMRHPAFVIVKPLAKPLDKQADDGQRTGDAGGKESNHRVGRNWHACCNAGEVSRKCRWARQKSESDSQQSAHRIAAFS